MEAAVSSVTELFTLYGWKSKGGVDRIGRMTEINDSKATLPCEMMDWIHHFVLAELYARQMIPAPFRFTMNSRLSYLLFDRSIKRHAVNAA